MAESILGWQAENTGSISVRFRYSADPTNTTPSRQFNTNRRAICNWENLPQRPAASAAPC